MALYHKCSDADIVGARVGRRATRYALAGQRMMLGRGGRLANGRDTSYTSYGWYNGTVRDTQTLNTWHCPIAADKLYG